jgi:hypothetical protein
MRVIPAAFPRVLQGMSSRSKVIALKPLLSTVLLSLAILGSAGAVDASSMTAGLVGTWDQLDVGGAVASTTTFAADETYEQVSAVDGRSWQGEFGGLKNRLFMSTIAADGEYWSTVPYRLIRESDRDRLVRIAFDRLAGSVGVVGQWFSWQHYVHKDAAGAELSSGTLSYDLTLNADGTGSITFATSTDPSVPVITRPATYTVTGEDVELTIDEGDGRVRSMHLCFVDDVLGFGVMTRR